MVKMASLQPVFILAICFALVFNRIGADSVNIPAGEDDLLQKTKYVGSDSELQQLESSLEEKTQELKKKDNEIALLQSKITSLQVNGGWLPVSIARRMSDLEKKWKEHGKPNADAILQKAVEKKAEAVRWAEPHIETIKTKWVPAAKEQWLIASANIGPHVHLLRDRALEAYVASKAAVTPHVLKVQESADPYFQEDLKKAKAQSNTNEVMEEDLKKAKAQSNTNEVMEVNGGWLPVSITRYMSDLEKNWKEHGKPNADAILQKAVEKKAEAVRWAEPHIETIKTKWVPAAKEQWSITSANIEPHVHLLRDRALEAYVASKAAMTPHVLKVQELADPYFQEVKKFSKPYIDYFDSITRPYLDKLGIVLKPCMKIAVHVYGKFLNSASKIVVHVYGKFIKSASKIAVHVHGKFIKSASIYHHQAQGTVEEELKQHELTS